MQNLISGPPGSHPELKADTQPLSHPGTLQMEWRVRVVGVVGQAGGCWRVQDWGEDPQESQSEALVAVSLSQHRPGRATGAGGITRTGSPTTRDFLCGEQRAEGARCSPSAPLLHLQGSRVSRVREFSLQFLPVDGDGTGAATDLLL